MDFSELKDSDRAVFDIIKEEAERQENGIELIASENFTSKSVMEAMGSFLTNKYAEVSREEILWRVLCSR